ncbi:glutamate receptor-like [Ixodes scapularis]
MAISVNNPTSEAKDVAVVTEIIVPIDLVIMAGRLSRHQSNIFGLIQIFSWEMKAMMMIKNEVDRIDSMEDLSTRSQIKPLVPAESAIVSSIRQSKNPSYQKVGRMIQMHKSERPPATLFSITSLRQVVRSEAVLIASPASMAGPASRACMNYTSGEYYVGSKPMFTFNSVFYLNKKMPPLTQRAINSRILWLRESGLIAKWWAESSGNWQGCGQTISDGSLTFSDFKDLLFFWLFMLAASAFVCVTEILRDKLSRNRLFDVYDVMAGLAQLNLPPTDIGRVERSGKDARRQSEKFLKIVC